MNGFVSFYICYKHFYICHRGLWVMLAHFLTNPANELCLLRQISKYAVSRQPDAAWLDLRQHTSLNCPECHGIPDDSTMRECALHEDQDMPFRE